MDGLYKLISLFFKHYEQFFPRLILLCSSLILYRTKVSLVTGFPLSNLAIYAFVKKYTKAFKSNKSMSPHNLRHTYGTNSMGQSGDIHFLMTQLGHTSTTTAALYTNPELEKAKKAAKQMGERRTNYRE
ncbi:tyrosine-type recombinase/integrase [Peribacillus frigoritolerans]